MNIKQKVTTMATMALMSFATIPMFAVQVSAAKCGSADTSIISCDPNSGSNKPEDNAIWKVLLQALQIMTAGIGIVAVGGIAYGGFLYATAGDKSEQIKKAISVITNVVIGIVAYALMFIVINFLIPGGLFAS